MAILRVFQKRSRSFPKNQIESVTPKHDICYFLNSWERFKGRLTTKE
jgi:hypothetical protein